MSLDFNGKVAIVTGSGGGIGKGYALELAKRGAKIVVNDLGGSVDGTGGSLSAAEKVVEEIKAAGGESISNGASVTDMSQVEEMVKQTMDTWGRIDILVNNAGILRDKSFSKVTDEDFRLVLEVHLMGTVNCTKAVWDIMKEQSYGRILVTSSSSGVYGNFGQTNYVASKSGVIGMTKVWARELGKYNIRVNAVAPGFIETDMTKNLPEKVVQLMNDKVPLRRWGKTKDIANAYTFLASENASYISGAVLNVDGGVVV